MGTGSFPGLKRPGCGVDNPPPSVAEVKERVELYLYSPSGPSWPVLGRILPLLFIRICSSVNDEVTIAEPLAKLRGRWEGNIKMYLHGTGCGWWRGLDLSASGYGPVVGCCEIGINFLSMKQYLSDLKTHFLPRSKHSLLRL